MFCRIVNCVKKIKKKTYQRPEIKIISNGISVYISSQVDYFHQCKEMQLDLEYKVPPPPHSTSLDFKLNEQIRIHRSARHKSKPQQNHKRSKEPIYISSSANTHPHQTPLAPYCTLPLFCTSYY